MCRIYGSSQQVSDENVDSKSQLMELVSVCLYQQQPQDINADVR
jgi:hypothetical protein